MRHLVEDCKAVAGWDCSLSWFDRIDGWSSYWAVWLKTIHDVRTLCDANCRRAQHDSKEFAYANTSNPNTNLNQRTAWQLGWSIYFALEQFTKAVHRFKWRATSTAVCQGFLWVRLLASEQTEVLYICLLLLVDFFGSFVYKLRATKKQKLHVKVCVFEQFVNSKWVSKLWMSTGTLGSTVVRESTYVWILLSPWMSIGGTKLAQEVFLYCQCTKKVLLDTTVVSKVFVI